MLLRSRTITIKQINIVENTNYIYQEGDYHCEVLGNFLGGGKGEDGINRYALLGTDNNEVLCEECL